MDSILLTFVALRRPPQAGHRRRPRSRVSPTSSARSATPEFPKTRPGPRLSRAFVAQWTPGCVLGCGYCLGAELVALSDLLSDGKECAPPTR